MSPPSLKAWNWQCTPNECITKTMWDRDVILGMVLYIRCRGIAQHGRAWMGMQWHGIVWAFVEQRGIPAQTTAWHNWRVDTKRESAWKSNHGGWYCYQWCDLLFSTPREVCLNWIQFSKGWGSSGGPVTICHFLNKKFTLVCQLKMTWKSFWRNTRTRRSVKTVSCFRIELHAKQL